MKRFLYHLKWRKYHPNAFTAYTACLHNERLSLDELMARQEVSRQRLVRKALEVSTFYRNHYAAVGFSAADIGGTNWFEGLPIVTKKDLREHFDAFVNPSLRHFLRVSTTGGSTGAPTKTGYDMRIPEEIYSWRLQNRFGVSPWDHHAYIWRDRRSSMIAKLTNALLWWPTKHLKLDASFMTESSIAVFLSSFNKLKPLLLQGYVGAVCQVAQYALDHNVKLWSPNVVWTTSAPLSSVQRAVIMEAFGAPVCDEYGSCECRWIASQCNECKGLHVNVEHVYIEFVDKQNLPVSKGEYGRTLITNLEDFVFPLIRYENDDRGRWLLEQCPCGRTLPCIDSVKGREVENFVLPSGKIITGEYLTTIFDCQPEAVKNFRVIQHKDLSITVEYVPGSQELRTSIFQNFEETIGREVPVKFRKIDGIVHDGGKTRYVVREK